VLDTMSIWDMFVETYHEVPNVAVVHCADGDVTYERIEKTASLSYRSNEDGTCRVIGVGTCPTRDVVIPSVSPDGETVVRIEGFNEIDLINSLTIPVSVTSIPSLSSCYELTHIIYEGTIAEWNAIDFGEVWLPPFSHITVYCTDGEISFERDY